jgi:DNA topoisomerase-1
LPWRVAELERKQTRQRPSPPFITSTLQQAGNSRLRMSPARIMRVAQRLYEGIDLGGGRREGLITYMRTDSTTLSEKALRDIESYVRREFGAEYSEGPRRYRTRSKGAQEAHEAIRPTDVERTPASVAGVLEPDELAVYRLIWNRAVASQMADARLDKTTVDFTVGSDAAECVFRSTGQIVRFAGYLQIYGDPEQDSRLPELVRGQRVGGADADEPIVEIENVSALRHETTPPARYTEATLVRKLEEEGIGRPSTYAPVIQTIQDRGYVVKKSSALLPTYIGIAVTRLLREHFPRYVDVAFTAELEEVLDEIARGSEDGVGFLRSFYLGGDGDSGLLQRIESEMDRIGYPAIPLGSDPETGRELRVRVGRTYSYVEADGDETLSAPLPVDLLIDELTIEKARELLDARRRLREPIGRHPDTGENIYVRTGPYGPYLQLGDDAGERKPKRVSLGRDTDPESIELARAIELLRLPRELGVDPETGKKVRTGLGRYGPYVERDRVFAPLDSVDELFSIDLAGALERIRNKNRKPVLKELGTDPGTGREIQILKGRYGPYVSDGEINATLGKHRTPDETTLEDALELLAQAAERQKRQGPGSTRRATAGKAKQKKKAAKRSAASRGNAGESARDTSAETKARGKTGRKRGAKSRKKTASSTPKKAAKRRSKAVRGDTPPTTDESGSG